MVTTPASVRERRGLGGFVHGRQVVLCACLDQDGRPAARLGGVGAFTRHAARKGDDASQLVAAAGSELAGQARQDQAQGCQPLDPRHQPHQPQRRVGDPDQIQRCQSLGR